MSNHQQEELAIVVEIGVEIVGVEKAVAEMAVVKKVAVVAVEKAVVEIVVEKVVVEIESVKVILVYEIEYQIYSYLSRIDTRISKKNINYLTTCC